MSRTHQLVLVPTPLEESLPLEASARDLLEKQCLEKNTLILVEDHKVARQRWLRWGLPREAIERFRIFDEHTQDQDAPEVVRLIQSGSVAFLMSDGGLPAFCDPGQTLVRLCHEAQVTVKSTPFPNSISLAIALSGMDHRRFYFLGFPSTHPQERKNELNEVAGYRVTSVIMDTPYRLNALLSDLGESALKSRKFYLVADLGSLNEKSFYGNLEGLRGFSKDLHKPEFVLVVSGS